VQVLANRRAGGLHESQIRAAVACERSWNANDSHVRGIKHAWIGAGGQLIVNPQRCDFSITHIRHGAATAGDRVNFGRIDVEAHDTKSSSRELDGHRQASVAEPDHRDASLSCA
jgi:hypothetical protein